ncbi:hypothetical protein [Streptomyces sp. sk226]|uniref:hypothetical protein n=1 Tax=Streptomyces sp. sk226 TaxID=2034268 RepID=UPI000BF0AEBA|nr:hypothetical protein [Streptomyces sp. sk226]
MSSTPDFPEDLLAAQAALHRTRHQTDEYARTLPWSVEPMPGWEADKQLHSAYRSSKPDSPGYTTEQAEELGRLRAELLRLSEVVMTHPFWGTLEAGTVVEARMRLKHAHEPVDEV